MSPSSGCISKRKDSSRQRLWNAAILTMLLVAIPIARAESLYSVHTIIDNEEVITGFGRAISLVGDLNSDDIGDFAVGAPQWQPDSNNHDRGRVKIFAGDDLNLLYTIEGTTNEQQLGSSLTDVGDLNVDGVSDLLVGGIGIMDISQSCPPSSWNPHGIVRAISGSNPTGAPLFTLTGTSNSLFGYAVASLGDITGSSASDFVVSAPNDNKGSSDPCDIVSGDVFFYEGDDATPSLNSTIPVGQGYGHVLANIGDVDGDSVADFAVAQGASGGNPIVNVYSGADRSVLSSITLTGAATPLAIAGLGDITGSGGTPDGDRDVAIGGSDGLATGGYVWIYRGDGAGNFTLQHTLTGSTGDHFGSAIVSLGDVDGDSTPDFVVVAQGENTTQNYVRVYSGDDRTIIEDYLKLHDAVSLQPPTALGAANLGDLDGDSIDDFAIGYKSYNTVYVFYSDTAAPCDNSLPLWLDNETVATSIGLNSESEIVAGDLDGQGGGYSVTADSGDTVVLRSATAVQLKAGLSASASSTGTFRAAYDTASCS